MQSQQPGVYFFLHDNATFNVHLVLTLSCQAPWAIENHFFFLYSLYVEMINKFDLDLKMGAISFRQMAIKWKWTQCGVTLMRTADSPSQT